jgi:hypothetical protein
LRTGDLLKGIAVIVDDEINKKRANINNLVSQIEKRKMPYLAYKQLPEGDIVEHFSNISFLLLDWKLRSEGLTEFVTQGVKAPPLIDTAETDEIVAFLKKLRESCFTPVFIFTNESVDTVKRVLGRHGLYRDDRSNYIFVKSKKELTGRTRLFRTIEEWISKTPSVYALMAWEKEYRKAINKLFHEFYDLSPNWPIILWKAFVEDGVNMSLELGEVIARNLHSRMTPFTFDDKILNKRGKKVPKEEVRKVLEGERFTESTGLHEDSICAGDVFNIDGHVFLNIRPDCDCVVDRGASASGTDLDVDLYLIRGSKMTIHKERKAYRKKYGNFEEIDSQSIAFSIIKGKTYDFRFKNLEIRKWSEIKATRVGRLLPPYITRVQQRYSLYLQRQGLPRTPEVAVLGK